MKITTINYACIYFRMIFWKTFFYIKYTRKFGIIWILLSRLYIENKNSLTVTGRQYNKSQHELLATLHQIQIWQLQNAMDIAVIGLRWLRHFQRYFSNIVVILLVEETVVHGENHRILVYDSHILVYDSHNICTLE